MYKLTKLSIQEGQSSSVHVGETSSSNTIKVIREVSPEDIITGDEVYVGSNFNNFIKTSQIEDVHNDGVGTVTLITQTSTYHLEKIK